MNITKMKNRNINVVGKAVIVIFALMVILSAGCINLAKKAIAGESQDAIIAADPLPETGVPSADEGHSDPLAVGRVATPVSTANMTVKVINPDLYITQDPYRLPYRDHGNWSTVDPLRVKKYPQYSQTFVLRSNSTAVMVNATEAPLQINLTFKPQWTRPDQTGGSYSTVAAGEEPYEDRPGVANGVRMSSFVFPHADVTVYDEDSHTVIERNGYGNEFSVDMEKTITIYSEGSYVITLQGDFIDINIALTTGAGAEKPLTSQAATTSRQHDEGDWG